jgi:hypothetical protein
VGRKSACFEIGSRYVQQCEDSLSGDAPLTEAETQLLRELQDSAAGEEAHLQALAHARHWLRGFAARLPPPPLRCSTRSLRRTHALGVAETLLQAACSSSPRQSRASPTWR